MREEQDHPDRAHEWAQEQDDRLRASLGALRQDVDAAGIPDVRFVMRRAGRQRHRAVVGIAAGAAAVLGLSWFGYQSLDGDSSTAPAGDGTSVTTERDDSTTDDGTTDEATTEDTTTDNTTDDTSAAPVQADDLVLAESGGPDLNLFVPPTLWASETFTGGAATSAGGGEFETTALFDCDPDDVTWGADDEGTFGVMNIWSGDGTFGAQRVRVLDSADAAQGYAQEVNAALSSCEAPAEADNIDLVIEPLDLSGAYRITTTFRDGSEPLTDFYYVVQHEGTPEAASTFRLTDWSAEATNQEAVAELERLADLATGH